MLPLSKQQEFFVPEADVTSDSDDADSDDNQSNSSDSSCVDSSVVAADEAQDVQEDSDVNEDEVTSSQRSRHSMSCDHIEEENLVVNRKPNKN